jgi:hypothetical protein
MDKLQNKAYDEQKKCISEGIVKSSHNHELNSLKYQKESLKERYRQIKNEKGLNKQQLEAFIDEDINIGMIVWKDKFTLSMPQEHATIFGQIWSKISKESTTSDFVYQTMQDAKQELLLEYPRRRTNIGELKAIARQSLVITQKPAIRYKSTATGSSVIAFNIDEGPKRVVSRANTSTSIKPRYKRHISSSSSEDESIPVHVEDLYNEVPAKFSVDIPVYTSNVFNEKPVTIDTTEFNEHFNKERDKLAAMYALERVRLEESKDNLLKQFPDLLIEDSKAAYRPGRHALTSLDRCVNNLTDMYAYKLVALNGYLSGPKKDTTLEDNEMYLKTFAGKMDGNNYKFTYEDKLKGRPWHLAKTDEEKQAEHEAYLRGEAIDEGDPESEEDEATLDIERSFLRRYYNN